ncbi:MAG: recombinase RecA [Candidatus Paceibacterota bacterium]
MAKKKEPKTLQKKGDANIEDTLREIQTKFGEESITKLGERPKVDIDAIPSGSVGLDFALGVGGFPRGRVIEIYGPESSGKTTLALHAVAGAQKQGGIAAFIDAEHAMDPEYTKKLGVNINDLLISQPDNGEQALEITESLVRSGKVDIIVVDSVAALTPRDEIEGEMGDAQVGKQARLMSQALRKLTAIVAKSNTTVIFINQIREKIGVMFGCFAYDTKVLLADGTREKIGKLVNQTIPATVLSYNFETKQTEAKQIIDWHTNGETDSFLQFFVQNHTGNGRRGFSCTPDHKIHTPTGWKKAKDIREGDEVSVRIHNTDLSPEQEQVIIGSLLGDGNIKKEGEQTAYFREEHAAAQSGYVSWLAEELGDLTRNVTPETSRGTAVMETKALLRIGDLHSLFYIKKKKVVPESIVETITPRAIALWFCGDGSLQTGTSLWKGTTYDRRPRATLYVNGFSSEPENRERIERIFARFGITPTWRMCGEYTVLSFSVAESEKLFELIAPFVPASMEYKLPTEYRGRYYGRAVPSQSTQSEVLRPMRVKEIRTRVPYQDGQRISKQRFDITVADNHNFFVDDCLVSNSPETTPGGRALKFYTSVRLDVRRIAQIKKGDAVMGGRVRVKVVKNKVAAPFKQTEFDLMYNEGISKEGELIALGERFGLITKAGSSYSYGEEKLGRGYDAARQFLQQKENKKIANALLKEIREKLQAEA